MLAVIVAALALALPTAASASVGSGTGKYGYSAVPEGFCQYGWIQQGGLLQLTAGPPVIQGANLRRRKRNEWTMVRYLVTLVDLAGTQLNATGWSNWQWVRERSTVTWPGSNWFQADWRGFYRLGYFVEWATAKRRVGTYYHLVDTYKYEDQYGAGPYGPLSSCGAITAECSAVRPCARELSGGWSGPAAGGGRAVNLPPWRRSTDGST